MKYRIKVEKVIPPEDNKKYPSNETIYEQTVESLNLQAVIRAVNNPSFTPNPPPKMQVDKGK